MDKAEEQQAYEACRTVSLSDSEYKPVSETDYQRARKELLERYKETQMGFELQLFKDRQQWVKEDPLSEWFLATRERTAIFHQFNLTRENPNGQTVGMISQSLSIPRETISRLLSECHALKYIYRNKSIGFQRYYLPSEHLLKNGTWYAEYYVSQILSIERWPNREGFFNLKRVENATRETLAANMTHDHIVNNKSID
tara:strand:+ start:222 stop:815 length:594 start_codon:yes stop_codon:yes gene_type:complete